MEDDGCAASAAELQRKRARPLTTREKERAVGARNAFRLWAVQGVVTEDKEIRSVRLNLLKTMQRLEEYLNPLLQLPFTITFDGEDA